MTEIYKNPIIPINPYIHGEKDGWDYKAICIFAATGFFLDEDTYFKGLNVLKPATTLYSDGSQETYFHYHYSPRDITLKQATHEFAALFESIIKEQTGHARVILPLSGGLDSRTQAAAFRRIGADVQSYSYEFQEGYAEAEIAQKIAIAQGFPFRKMVVRPGYLWGCIDKLAQINGCYSEFTHSRQMAFIDEYAAMGDVFNLGHWGDVLFDDMGVPDNLPFQQQVDVVLKKILKKGGRELAESLWSAWGINGSFYDYIRARVEHLLQEIDIPHSANARIRAFKSLYWAPRWTSVNLSVFKAVRPITLPYYDDRMCEFICTLPEKYLSGRQIQIEYLKSYAPQLAAIIWQDHRPFNLYHYHWDTSPWNLPFRIIEKGQRVLNQLRGKKRIQRNWELQFLGEFNMMKLNSSLNIDITLTELIPIEVVNLFQYRFQYDDPLKYAHPISVLLTISKFKEICNHEYHES